MIQQVLKHASVHVFICTAINLHEVFRITRLVTGSDIFDEAQKLRLNFFLFKH